MTWIEGHWKLIMKGFSVGRSPGKQGSVLDGALAKTECHLVFLKQEGQSMARVVAEVAMVNCISWTQERSGHGLCGTQALRFHLFPGMKLGWPSPSRRVLPGSRCYANLVMFVSGIP